MSTDSDGRRYLPTYDGCYVCGQHHPRGLCARFYVEGNLVKADFRPTELHTGYKGIVHGAVISGLLDEAMGWPLALRNGRMCVTAELQVQFLKPMAPGREYVVLAWADDDTQRFWIGRGEVRDAQGVVYATGTGKYFPLPAEESAKIDAYLTYQPGDLRWLQPHPKEV
jgi:uncharacterized protein (TIGR00369 family)